MDGIQQNAYLVETKNNYEQFTINRWVQDFARENVSREHYTSVL